MFGAGKELAYLPGRDRIVGKPRGGRGRQLIPETSAYMLSAPKAIARTQWWAICLVILATVLNSAAQVSFKFASGDFGFSLQGLLANWPFLLGLAIYIIAAVLLIISFSGGELSVLDPLQSASFIWTILAAWLILKEQISIPNIVGIAVIISGIVLLTSTHAGAGDEPS